MDPPPPTISSLLSWPNWRDAHPELNAWNTVGVKQMDGYADAARLDSYVMRHFNMMAFTQVEQLQSVPLNPPKDIKGAWIGTKKIMSHASLDITREGGNNIPFLTYYSEDKGPGTSLLLMEILDVKQVSWPEPGPKFLKQLKTVQEVKFGDSADGPLNPMMQTPKVPLVVVRYSYVEGCPEGGSQFTLHLESRLEEIMPAGTSANAIREKFQYHLECGEEMPEEHIRMFARLLSYNAGLVDQEWRNDLQGHWFLSKEVEKETNISFFVPCPRLRFRALEEIATGNSAVAVKSAAHAAKMTASRFAAHVKQSKANWPEHKGVCKFSRKILNEPTTLPTNKFYIPARAYVSWVLEFGFAVEQEAVKMGGSAVDECPRNEYGDERFVCRAQLSGEDTVFLFDRRRSVLVRAGEKECRVAAQIGVVIPFHKEGHTRFVELIKRRGYGKQVLYVTVRRVGDCLEIDLEDLPNQEKLRWN